MIVLRKYLSLHRKIKQMSDSTSRSGNDTLTVETGVRIPYPIQKKESLKGGSFFVYINLI